MDPYEEFLRWYQAKESTDFLGGGDYQPLDLPALMDAEFELEWLVEGLWPAAKHLHLFAAHKTGKSLVSLHIAVCLARGIDAFTGQPTKPRDVTYIDREMSQADVQERLLDMGLYKPIKAGELERLHYHLYPPIGYLDTVEGASKLMKWVEQDKSDVVIIDTLSRVVKGEENSNDTYKNFYNCTGALLKANGVAMLRLDHEGHQAGHSRGASSKADDVDLVYRLKAVESGHMLEMQFARVAYVRKAITLVQGADPLTFSASDNGSWPAGTVDRANELDKLGCPEGISVRQTQKWLRDQGHSVGKTEVLGAAIRYRNERIAMPGLE